MFTFNNIDFYTTYQEVLAKAPLELRNKIEWVSVSEVLS